MDVANGSTADGARIQQWDCYGGTPEKWRLDVISIINGIYYYAFVNMNSGKCLDVPNGNPASGVELNQWTCWSGAMQQWSLHTFGNSLLLKNMATGKCVSNNWGGAGAALQQTDCAYVAAQTWIYY
jgi:hypothetical protein